jgi:hypothetical protein
MDSTPTLATEAQGRYCIDLSVGPKMEDARVGFNQAGSDTLKTKLNSFGSKLRN